MKYVIISLCLIISGCSLKTVDEKEFAFVIQNAYIVGCKNNPKLSLAHCTGLAHDYYDKYTLGGW